MPVTWIKDRNRPKPVAVSFFFVHSDLMQGNKRFFRWFSCSDARVRQRELLSAEKDKFDVICLCKENKINMLKVLEKIFYNIKIYKFVFFVKEKSRK